MLSERECEVLRLVSKGYTNQQISLTLYISKRTVDGHLAKIYGKLEVNNRVQAIQKAQEAGLIRLADARAL